MLYFLFCFQLACIAWNSAFSLHGDAVCWIIISILIYAKKIAVIDRITLWNWLTTDWLHARILLLLFKVHIHLPACIIWGLFLFCWYVWSPSHLIIKVNIQIITWTYKSKSFRIIVIKLKKNLISCRCNNIETGPILGNF